MNEGMWVSLFPSRELEKIHIPTLLFNFFTFS